MSSEWAEQPAAAGSHGVPGQALAAQREAMGWTVEQVADQLKMAVRQVVALEAGDYASLPGPAVVRGFVRAYAKVVKLDAAPLVAMIALDAPAAGDATGRTMRRDKPTSFTQVRFPTNGRKRSTLPLGLIGGATLLVLAAVGAWQFGLVPGSLLAPAAPAANAPAAAGMQASVTVLPPPVVDKAANDIETTLVKPGEELKPVQNPSVPLISVLPPSTATPAAATGANTPAGVDQPVAAPAVAVAAAGANALVINVREDSWIEVRPAKGKSLFSGLVRAGSTETVEVSQPVTLIVGKPSGVDATLRGAAVALPPIAGGTVSRVSLK